MIRGKIEYATIAMALAINFKQMALYFSIPFAVYALSQLAQKASAKYKESRFKQLQYLLFRIFALLFLFILVIGVIW